MSTPTTILLSSILVSERLREDYGDVQDLADSITRYGQIQPIVLRKEDNRLIAGGRRYAAHMLLGKETINYVYRENLSNDELHELELEENLRRKEMTWQENCISVAKIHTMKLVRNLREGQSWGHRETAEMLGINGHANVTYSIKVAGLLNADPSKSSKFWKADSLMEALRLIIRDQEDAAVAELARRSVSAPPTEQPKVPSLLDGLDDDYEEPIVQTDVEKDLEKCLAREKYLSNPHNDPNEFESYWTEKHAPVVDTTPVVYLSNTLFHIPCIEFALQRGPEFCDHIITDIPYAIDMEMLDQGNPNGGMAGVDQVENEHDEEENKELMRKFFPTAFRSLREDGFLITWCDIMQWQFMYDLAIEAGFKVQRWPITWHKTHQCMNQTVQYNFTKNTEIAIVCRKGKATMAEFSQTSVISASNDEWKKKFGHPFVKPYLIWEFLIKHTTQPGQLIWEPFSGRGSGVISMLKLGRRVLATEKQLNHFNHLLENTKQFYLETFENKVNFK